MANRERGEVVLVVAGKTYTLRYSVNALCELEDALDKPANAIMQTLRDPAAVRIKVIRAVVWAGLRENHPEMTEKAVGELLTVVGFPAAIEKVNAALVAAFPDSAEVEGDASARPLTGEAAGTG